VKWQIFGFHLATTRRGQEEKDDEDGGRGLEMNRDELLKTTGGGSVGGLASSAAVVSGPAAGHWPVPRDLASLSYSSFKKLQLQGNCDNHLITTALQIQLLHSWLSGSIYAGPASLITQRDTTTALWMVL